MSRGAAHQNRKNQIAANRSSSLKSIAKGRRTKSPTMSTAARSEALAAFVKERGVTRLPPAPTPYNRDLDEVRVSGHTMMLGAGWTRLKGGDK